MNGNHYLIDGVKYDRVTNILNIIHDKGLEDFRRARGFDYVDQVFDDAANRGKVFHSAMKLVADGKFSGMIADSFNGSEMLESIWFGKEWFEKNVKEVLYAEVRVANKSLRIAGTVDLIARMNDGTICLIDWKTGSVVSPKWRLQIGAYTYMAECQFDIDIHRRLVVQVNGGKLKEHPIETSKEMDKNLFFYCLYLHREVR